MENNLFKNNLNNLGKYNPSLVKKISNLEEVKTPWEFREANSGDIVLYYNGVYVHDNEDPIKEAQEIFSKLEKYLISN